MTITNLSLFWNDMHKIVVDVNGSVTCKDIQITGLLGAPEYRLGSGENYEPLTADGFNWKFETSRLAGTYSLEIRDSNTAIAVKLIDFEIQSSVNKTGRDSYLELIKNVQINRNQIIVNVHYVTNWFDRSVIVVNAQTNFIPDNGYAINWTDISDPETAYFGHLSTTDSSRNADGQDQPWTAYRPPADPAAICDLFVSEPSIKNPGKTIADGEITVNATSSGDITYSLDGSPYQISNTFTGLPAGTYLITILSDDGSGSIPHLIPNAIPGGQGATNCTIQSIEVVLNEKFIRVPKLNAIEFKIPDQSRQNFNNTLFVDMKLPHRVRTNKYCQIYFDNDVGWVQFQSTFVNHEIKIYDFNTGTQLSTITPLKVYDSPEGFAYLEFSIDFSLYPDKTIQVKIVPENEIEGNGGLPISEPLEVISTDIDNKYVKIQYKSNVNCSDVYWVSGFSPFFYIEGYMADTFPTINKEVSRDCEWNINTQSRELTRQIKVNAKQQPYYIFEKLQWALGNGQGPGNYYSVNDVWVNSEDGAWEEPEFPNKYSLADSSAQLEQRDVFVSDQSETPAPPITINYLLVNPDNEGGLLLSENSEYTLI